jgi:7-carboxy-7-deazaguanine synthase
MLKINEIFKSIQGESTYAGRLCSFVRLSECNLRCSYCDTTYAFTEGTMRSVASVYDEVALHGTSLVEITGGEPLLQKEIVDLCNMFLEHEYTVLVETNGSIDIGMLPERCIRIVDVKCPGSGEGASFYLPNINVLHSTDEIKFVISSYEDFVWSVNFVNKYELDKKAVVLFSPNSVGVSASQLASWIVDTNAPARLGLQLHKIIWGDKRGV